MKLGIGLVWIGAAWIGLIWAMDIVNLAFLYFWLMGLFIGGLLSYLGIKRLKKWGKNQREVTNGN